jgi:hypothetical protein
MRKLLPWLLMLFMPFCQAVDNKVLPREQKAKKDDASTSVPVLGRVVSIASLYTANNVNWIATTVQTNDGFRTINAKAVDHPELMHVRTGDMLNMVITEQGGQAWVLSLVLVGADMQPVYVEEAKADVVQSIVRDRLVSTVTMKNGDAYRIDRKIGYWESKLMKGNVVTFKYLQRPYGRWATSAVRSTWGRPYDLRNTHADPVIVTKIVSLRYGPDGRRASDWWYYISTNHEKIRFEVDSRWNSDVRLQCVGSPPIWHADREPSPYASSIMLSRPVPQDNGPSPINVNIQGPNVNTGVNNVMDARVSSDNNVSGTNLSTNSNSNSGTNVNSNANSNSNNNANSSVNSNSNDNANSNANDNTNSNSNDNTSSSTSNNSNSNASNQNVTNR